MLRKSLSFAAASVVLLGGCATLQPSLPSLGPRTYSVRVFETGSKLVVQSGTESASASTHKVEVGEFAVLADTRSSSSRLIIHAKPESAAALDATFPAWTVAMAAAIDSLNRRVFSSRLDIDTHVYLTPAENVRLIRESSVEGRSVSVSFAFPAFLMLEDVRRAVSDVLAHEAYHALLNVAQVLDRKVYAVTPPQKMLEEVGAELFGICGSLEASGMALRTEVHRSDDSPGAVLTDEFLRRALSAQQNGVIDKGLGVPRQIAEAIASTIWSDVVGPVLVVERDSASGDALLNVCSNENLGSLEGVTALVRRHASDGTDAKALPSFDSVRGQSTRTFLEAKRKWRLRHGLPAQ